MQIRQGDKVEVVRTLVQGVCARGWCSSVAALAKDRRFASCSAPSFPILHYLSAITGALLSCIILDIVFPSSLG